MPYFLLAVALTLVPWFMNTFRVMIWTRFLGYRIPFRKVFKIIIGSEMSAALSPSAMGGAPVKAGMLIQEGLNPGEAASLTTFGTVEDVCFLLTLFPFVLVFLSSSCFHLFKGISERLHLSTLILVVFIFLLIGLWILNKKVSKSHKSYRFRKLQVKIKKIWSDFKSVYRLIIKRGKRKFALTFTLAIIQWICRYSVITVLVLSLGLPIKPFEFFLLQWIVFISMYLIPLPGASGGAEAIFYMAYKSILPGNAIGLITVGWRFLTFYLLLILDVILFIILTLMNSKSAKRGLSYRYE
jgi:uncharacterized protein (TIRG00374 family)